MNAAEAREIRRKAELAKVETDEDRAKALLDRCYQYIGRAAAAGRSSVAHPIYGLRGGSLGKSEAIVNDALRAEGFTVVCQAEATARGGEPTISW